MSLEPDRLAAGAGAARTERAAFRLVNLLRRVHDEPGPRHDPGLLPFAPGARLWLTPMEGANRLLAGTMSSSTWLPYAVMLGLWVVGLTVAGLRRLDEPTDRP